MITSISFTQKSNKNTLPAVTKPIDTVRMKQLKTDTLTLSTKIDNSSNNLATKKEIENRIIAYQKAFNKEPLPADLLKALTEPRIPLTLPDNAFKTPGTCQILLNKCLDWLKSLFGINNSKPVILDNSNNYKVMALRLDELKILDNSEGIFRGDGECYFLSMVTDGINEPVTLKVETFKGIKDGDDLFDKGLQKPYTIFLSNEGQFPRFIDFRFAVIEGDSKKSRTANEIIQLVQKDEVYIKILGAIKSLMEAGRPQVEISPLIDSAMKVAKRILDASEDDLLIYHVDKFDPNTDMGIGRHSAKNKYVELSYEVLAK